MTIPRVGVGLPILGPHAGPDAILMVATAADRLGFSSVSTYDRLLLPATPDWQNWAGLPDYPAYDVLETLTWVAAHTKRLRLITGTLNSLFQAPVVLARRFATLDHLSGGRVTVGIGQGWMPEEFAVAGVPPTRRGHGFEEHLAAMRACWGPDPVEHDGAHYPIARAKIGPKPINGHLPVLIGGVAQPSIERAARIGDGFLAAMRDWDGLAEHINWYRDAGGSGEIVVKAGPLLGTGDDSGLSGPWSPTSVLDDLARAATLGVDEVIWDLNIVNMDPRLQVEALEALAPSLPA